MTVQDQINEAISTISTMLTTVGGTCALSPIPSRVINSYPGQVVSWDECCGGQLTFRVSSLTPIWLDQGRGRVSLKTVCTIAWWEVVIEVKIIRCVAAINNAGTAPTPAQITSDGQQQLGDMQTILSALEQSVTPIYNMDRWMPEGPQGGCSGGFFNFMIRVDPEPCS